MKNSNLQMINSEEVDWQSRCMELQRKLNTKERLIVELRSHNKILLSQYNPDIHLNELKLKNQKLLEQIDELQREVKNKEDMLHRDRLVIGKLQDENIHIRQRFLELDTITMTQKPLKQSSKIDTYRQESKFIKSVIQLVRSCHPEHYFEDGNPTLRQCWMWINNILTEYCKLKGN